MQNTDMSHVEIHKEITSKLHYFHQVKKIPNLLFHGPCGSGKRTIVYDFIHTIYGGNKEKLKSYVMNVNCAYGKGIKFIRDELKFFAKTNIQTNDGNIFKSVILTNADKLTTDAQSALRRCIELYNHTTRFFIIVEDKYKLLKPILSRFCELYIHKPIVDGEIVNHYRYNIHKTFGHSSHDTQREEWLKKDLLKMKEHPYDIMKHILKLYEKGYSAMDIVALLDKHHAILGILEEERVHEVTIVFDRVRRDIKNEKILLYYILYFVYFSSCIDLADHSV